MIKAARPQARDGSRAVALAGLSVAGMVCNIRVGLSCRGFYHLAVHGLPDLKMYFVVKPPLLATNSLRQEQQEQGWSR
jgi:hypothetical protein